MLDLDVLGPFVLRDEGGGEVPIPNRKDRALFAYLVLLGRPVERDVLAGLLWPRTDGARGLKSVRQSLVGLRAAIDPYPGVLIAKRGQAPYVPAAAVDIDVARFEELARGTESEAWTRAVALRRGALLSEISLPDTPYQEWLEAERVRLDDIACNALLRLARCSGGALRKGSR